MTSQSTEAVLRGLLAERIVYLDGAMGTEVQARKLEEADFRGERFTDHPRALQGNNDLLVLTQPEVISAIHRSFLEAGSDILETNTFNATRISQADYGLEECVTEINREAARLAVAAAREYRDSVEDRPVFVAGGIGRTNRTASL